MVLSVCGRREVKKASNHNFTYCTFNNVSCEGDLGGGAISIDEDSFTNGNTVLIVQGCSFNNVHSKKDRGRCNLL